MSKINFFIQLEDSEAYKIGDNNVIESKGKFIKMIIKDDRYGILLKKSKPKSDIR
jgi:hypothetical protein